MSRYICTYVHTHKRVTADRCDHVSTRRSHAHADANTATVTVTDAGKKLKLKLTPRDWNQF